ACSSLAGMGGTVINATADVKVFKAGRLRMDVTGDVAAATIDAIGTCTAVDAPAIHFTGGTARLTLGGSNNLVTANGQPLTFGALTVPVPAEPGTVLATDAVGNTLQIVWPALAGLPAGPPTL